MTLARAALLSLLLATPAAAQSSSTATQPSADQQRRATAAQSAGPDFSARAIGLVTVQGFSAQDTFNGIFGSTVGPFWGGGAQIVLRSGIYAEVDISRFRKEGERAFLANGEATRLGFPLTATITPVEVTGGYRFRLRKRANLIPYLGAGIGSYGYQETGDSSEDDVNSRHAGYLVVGGVEYRVHRLIGLAFDVQYTHVPGILGNAGISEQANEKDLGGTAARFRVVVGR
jgi:hypothetical protein